MHDYLTMKGQLGPPEIAVGNFEISLVSNCLTFRCTLVSIAIAVPRCGYQILVGIRLASGKGSSRSALVAGVKDAIHLSYLSVLRRGTTVYRYNLM